jgi:RluA family pseudouridine synthase
MRHNRRVMVRRSTRVRADRAGARLDAFLGEWLPGVLDVTVSKSDIRRLVMAGAVSVNRRPVRRPGMTVEPSDRVDATIDPRRLHGARAADEPAAHVTVLFEDAWLLAVAKPAGLQVHASADAARRDLFTLVREMLARRSPDPYLALHHRLDLDTSGIVLFSTDAAANEGLARAFAERRAEKVYHALTIRPASAPCSAWTETGALARCGTGRSARMAVAAGGLESETAFRVARGLRGALLVEARPRTGRKHQVRAHLAAAGLPILGDRRYGGPARAGGEPVPRAMLHASTLVLVHPVTGRPLEIRCPWPDDFSSLVERLGRP